MTQRHVTFRASPVLMARIEELAKARGSTKAAAIRAAIVEAITPKDAPAVPDEHEILELLGQAARGGNVPAMRELLAHHREQRRDAQHGDDTFRGLDELARRRPGGRAS